MLRTMGLVAVVAMLAIQSSVTCDIHDRMAIFTGKTRTEYGKLLYQYRCSGAIAGKSPHYFWQVAR